MIPPGDVRWVLAWQRDAKSRRWGSNRRSRELGADGAAAPQRTIETLYEKQKNPLFQGVSSFRSPLSPTLAVITPTLSSAGRLASNLLHRALLHRGCRKPVSLASMVRDQICWTPRVTQLANDRLLPKHLFIAGIDSPGSTNRACAIPLHCSLQ
jgi:hypothetical protein